MGVEVSLPGTLPSNFGGSHLRTPSPIHVVAGAASVFECVSMLI